MYKISIICIILALVIWFLSEPVNNRSVLTKRNPYTNTESYKHGIFAHLSQCQWSVVTDLYIGCGSTNLQVVRAMVRAVI